MKKQPTMQVKPLKKIIRDPITMAILSHEKATAVPRNSYWMRRLLCGDVEQIELEIEQSKKPPKKIKSEQPKKEG